MDWLIIASAIAVVWALWLFLNFVADLFQQAHDERKRDAGNGGTAADRPGGDPRSYSERTADAGADDVQARLERKGSVALGWMAAVDSGDPQLDRMAHAVAIDHLRMIKQAASSDGEDAQSTRERGSSF